MRAPLVVLIPLAALVALGALWVWSEVPKPALGRSAKSWSATGSIDKGAVHLEVLEGGGWEVGWYFATPNNMQEELPRTWFPAYEHSASLRYFAIPIWLVMLPFAAWFAVAVVRRWRKRGLCPCGYDARGLDVCPECGRVSAEVKVDRSRG